MKKIELEVVACESTGADGHRAVLKPVAPEEQPSQDDLRTWGDPQLVITNVNAEGIKALQPGTRLNVQLTQAKSSATETAASPSAADADTAKPKSGDK